MDALRASDIALARATPLEEKAQQTLAAMEFGFELKRASLKASHPHASDSELEAMFRRWLLSED